MLLLLLLLLLILHSKARCTAGCNLAAMTASLVLRLQSYVLAHVRGIGCRQHQAQAVGANGTQSQWHPLDPGPDCGSRRSFEGPQMRLD